MKDENFLVRLLAWLSVAALVGLVVGTAFGYFGGVNEVLSWIGRDPHADERAQAALVAAEHEDALRREYYRGLYDDCRLWRRAVFGDDDAASAVFCYQTAVAKTLDLDWFSEPSRGFTWPPMSGGSPDEGGGVPDGESTAVPD